MTKQLKKIRYLKKGIGYFPSLAKEMNHGFSWGKSSGNMQFSFGEPIETRVSVQKFLNALGMGNIRDSINMLPEHSDRIVDLDRKINKNLKRSRYGRRIRCDAFFTNLSGITLTVKPADCTTALVFCSKSDSDDVVGIVHTGRRGVELKLPEKAIYHIQEKYGCDVEKIKIGILPHLFQMNRKFENIDKLKDKKVWKGFIKKKNGYYYPAETELALKQYKDAGIKSSNISIYEIDTCEAASRGQTFSYKYHLEMKKIGKKVPEGRFIAVVRKK